MPNNKIYNHGDTTKRNRLGDRALHQWGGYFTEAYPTHHHNFYTRKMLTAAESISDYKAVTAAQKAQLEQQDAKDAEAGLGVRTLRTPLYEYIGAQFNDSTGYYEMNGLTDITEQQMEDIYKFAWASKLNFGYNVIYAYNSACIPFFSDLDLRTLPAFRVLRSGGQTIMKSLFEGSFLESLVFDTYNNSPYGRGIMNLARMFCRCGKLKYIKNLLVGGTAVFDANTFSSCNSLEILELQNLNTSIDLRWSSKLNIESIEYIVDERFVEGRFMDNATANTITITLHANAYDLLTEELIAKAAAKDITFAKP